MSSYVSQQFLLFDNSSTANFKNWAQAISTALSSAGWTQTADTGQVNWSTVTVPASAAFVYEIWQPADALQTGSTAYYLKIQYGTSSGSPAGPRLRMQIGAGTDGSGNLTGFTTVLMEAGLTSTVGQGSTITYDCYFSGDTDRMSFMMWRGLGVQSAPFIYAIERTHNTDGTNSSDGVSLFGVSNSSSGTGGQDTLVFGVGNVGSIGSRCYVSLGQNIANASAAFNNNIPVAPMFPRYGKIGNPITTLATVNTQDVAEACLFSTTLYGATRTYVATGSWITNTAPTSSKICMRYD